ncbi:MAG TPA: class I adenylate-forming enzyme family protein [Kofleriaceae bacterium]|nr:class I adenylate-forming enzyme family protein [Kofleriaceae bacterium]
MKYAFSERVQLRSCQRPHDAAVSGNGRARRLTWAELWTRSQALALALAKHSPRARVLGSFDDGAWLAPMLVACSVRRVPFVPLAPSLVRAEVEAIARRLAPSILAVDRPTAKHRSTELLDVTEMVGGAGLRATAEASAPPAEPAALVLVPSSDLTRFSMLDEHALLATADALAERLGIGEADCILSLTPSQGRHAFADLASLILPLAAGASTALADETASDVDTLRGFIAETRATVAFLTPQQMSSLIARGAPRQALPDLRLVVAGGAPVSSDLWRRFEEEMSVPVHVLYGLAESCGAVSATEPGHRGRHAVGRPLGTEVRIDTSRMRGGEVAAFSDRRRPVQDRPAQDRPDMPERRRPRADPPPLGEVLVRGPGLMLGYYKNPRLSRSRFTEDGFLRTGDIGYLDDAGDLVITGRLSEVIIRDGVRIPAPAIDAVLAGHPEVRECKSFGVQDPARGEQVHTACSLRGAFDPSRAAPLEAWLAERLPAARRPDAVSVLAQLPRNSAGTISVAQLRSIATGALRDEIYAALTSQSNRRALPPDPERVKDTIDGALRAASPLRFACFWGVGRRGDLLEVDRMALDRLHQFAAGALRTGLPAAELIILLADVHGRVNGAPTELMRSYFEAVRDHAARLSSSAVTIRFRVLSDVRVASGLPDHARLDPVLTAEFDASPLREDLIQQAGRRGHADATAMARLYYAACRSEAPAISAACRDHIWLTYADPSAAALLPDLPILYVYSYHQGRSERPWFVDEAHP